MNLQSTKADETRNPMKLGSTDLKLKSERYPYFKINKNFDSNLGENEEQIDFKCKINYLNLNLTEITVR